MWQQNIWPPWLMRHWRHETYIFCYTAINMQKLEHYSFNNSAQIPRTWNTIRKGWIQTPNRWKTKFPNTGSSLFCVLPQHEEHELKNATTSVLFFCAHIECWLLVDWLSYLSYCCTFLVIFVFATVIINHL